MVKQTTILTIAGSDNTSGAGIQADIKTSCILGVYCLSAITIVTSQNSNKVSKLFNIPNHILESQLRASLDEYEINGVKVGLVNNLSTAKVIYDFLNNFKKKLPIVIDPILKSTNNKRLCDPREFQKIHKIFSELKPIYTPNLYEAKALIGCTNKKMNIEKIYQLLKKKYNCQFVVTGGDSVSEYCLDYVEIDGKVKVVKSKKKRSTSTHGSGCIFSSSLTIFLSKGYTLIESLKKSKKFINQQIDLSPKLDVKYGPLI
jgi:hydroxymethylpyrimidine/phosphomethylpyrimidine kinase